MFYTGIFSMNGDALMIRHDGNNEFDDDDVLSRIDVREKKLVRRRAGYVSNTGTIATIHIKKRHNKPDNIMYIRDQFNLHEYYGVTEVKVKEL